MALPVSHAVKSQCVIETKRMKQTRAADLRNRYRKRLWSWHGLRLPVCCIWFARFRRFHRPVKHKQNLSRSRIDTERMRAGRTEKKHAEHEEKKETHVEQMPPSDRRKYSWFAGWRTGGLFLNRDCDISCTHTHRLNDERCRAKTRQSRAFGNPVLSGSRELLK